MQHIKRIFESHPKVTKVDVDLVSRCAAEALNCAESCTACTDACLARDDVKELVRSIRLSQDCADVCLSTARTLLRLTEADQRSLESQIDSCIQACKACEDECMKFAERIEFCAKTARSCRTCIEVCSSLLNSVPV